ncbi:MAG: hypothetical protein V3T31_10330 [candidate division Zixibacteria bacterium]
MSRQKTAILPLRDFTNNTDAVKVATLALHAALAEYGIDYVTAEQLRPTMRRNRIRVAGQISQKDSRAIIGASETELLMVGSIDLYDDGERSQFGMAIRLVSPAEMTVISAASHAASADEFVGLFGLRKIDNFDSLVETVIRVLLDRLYSPTLRFNSKAQSLVRGRPIIVLPFDSFDENRFAGVILSTWILPELCRRGYTVVEPGYVRELTLPMGGMPVGSIDRPRMELLRKELNARLIITGAVDWFRPIRGSSLEAKPELRFGARVIDAETGSLLTAVNSERDGAESEIAFRLGRSYSLGELMSQSLHDMMDRFEDWMARNDFL